MADMAGSPFSAYVGGSVVDKKGGSVCPRPGLWVCRPLCPVLMKNKEVPKENRSWKESLNREEDVETWESLLAFRNLANAGSVGEQWPAIESQRAKSEANKAARHVVLALFFFRAFPLKPAHPAFHSSTAEWGNRDTPGGHLIGSPSRLGSKFRTQVHA